MSVLQVDIQVRGSHDVLPFKPCLRRAAAAKLRPRGLPRVPIFRSTRLQDTPRDIYTRLARRYICLVKRHLASSII